MSASFIVGVILGLNIAYIIRGLLWLRANRRRRAADANPPDPDSLPVIVIEAGKTVYLYPSQVRNGLAVHAVDSGLLGQDGGWTQAEWDAWHDCPCPEEEPITIRSVYQEYRPGLHGDGS